MHAALAQQQHAHLRVNAAQGAALGQRGVDFLTHELGTKGVVADGGTGHAHAVRWPLHALEALEVLLQQGVIGRQQQGALAHVEVQVEALLGVGLELRERRAQLLHGHSGLLAVGGQQQGQVAVVRERAHHKMRDPRRTSQQRSL